MSDKAIIQNLLDRVEHLECRAEFRDLISDYCHGFDRRDFDRFLSIWWEDCTWDIGPPFGAFEGHDGITTAVKEVLWPVWRETHHLASNLRFKLDDADNAHGSCDVDCMGATREDDAVQMISATYRDHFQRRDQVWKILRRDVTIHYFNPIPGAEMTAPQS